MSNYLKIDGIDGECADKDHKGWIEVQSYNFGLSQPTSSSASSSGGRTTGQAHFEDLNVTKLVDLATPVLMKHCANGKHIPKATLELFRADGDQKVKYITYEMEELIVSNISIGGGEVDVPIESLSLNFATIKLQYTQQASAGGSKGKADFGWNLKENTVM